LYYHGARYYAPWLGRWTQVDPADPEYGLNLYQYVSGNPTILIDPSGNEGKKPPSLTSQEKMWQRELNQWEKRAKEINNTYHRGSEEWKKAMAYVQPRINESRKKLAAVQDKVIEEQAERYTKRLIERGAFGRLELKPISDIESEQTDAPTGSGKSTLALITITDPMPGIPSGEKGARYLATWSTIRKYEEMGKRAVAFGGGDYYRPWDPYYQAWNFAREDYRKQNLKGGDPVLRNAEHYLFRKWLAHEGGTVTIPRGLPIRVPGQLNPIVLMSQWVMERIHDPVYNNAIRPDLESISDVSKAGPDMYHFEREGYAAGERLRKENPNENEELRRRWLEIRAVESHARKLRQGSE